MSEVLEHKSVLLSTKDAIINVDESQGIIEGYFSVFGNKDSDDDIITPGAYTKTLKENYGRIKHLYQHDPWRPLSGTKNENLVLSEDSYGLRFKSTISKTSYGKDVILLHLDGVIDENSVGFRTIRSNDKGKYRELTELWLMEGSSVTWAANELARTVSAKSLDKEYLFKKMNAVSKAIRNGKYENEDLFDSLDIYFKQLQTLISNLTDTDNSTKPEIKTSTSPEIPFSDFGKALSQFTNSLKS